MQKSILLLLFILKINFCFSQEVEVSHIVDNLTLSEDGRYSLAQGSNNYTILNNSTKEIVLEAKLINPAKTGLQNITDIGGTSMLIFGSLDRAVSFEYSSDTTLIKGYDLTSGEQIYQLNDIRLGVSETEEFVKFIMTVAGPDDMKIRTSNAIERNIRVRGKRLTGVVLNNSTLKTCIHPIGELNAMLIVSMDGVLFFDVTTGKIKWNQVDFPSGIAEAIYLPKKNSIIMVNAYATKYNKALSKKIIFNVDASTGELIWESEYSSTYKAYRSYIVGDRLLLDYYGMEIFDLNTGESLGMNVDQERVKQFSKLFDAGAATYAPGQEISLSNVVPYVPPVIGDEFVYYSVGMVQGEPWMYGNNKHIQKIDLMTGKIVWTSEKIVGINTELFQMELANNQLITKYKGMGLKSQYSLTWLDLESGKISKQIDKIKTNRDQELVEFQYEEDYLVDYDKDGLVYYNLSTAELIDSKSKKELAYNSVWLNNDILFFNDSKVEILRNNQSTVFNINRPKLAYALEDNIIIEGSKELLTIDSSSLKEVSRTSFKSRSYLALPEANTAIEYGERSVTFKNL